jgi:hypothetical protein
LNLLALFNSSTPKVEPVNAIVGPALCLGVPVLLLAVVSIFLLQDFRKWSATRKSKLMIFEKGFSYETESGLETCHWDDIKDITFRRVEVAGKHSRPRRVNLIRSIVKKDGEMISLAETLDLTSITKLITAARKMQ